MTLTRLHAYFAKLSFAVVGSGPAGMHTARLLFEHLSPPPRIAIIEKHPCPFGLLRFGVAPDHSPIKNASKTLRRVFEDARAEFIGNV